jgi:hypothetical protein
MPLDSLVSRANPLLTVLFERMVGFVQAQIRGFSGSILPPNVGQLFPDARLKLMFVGASGFERRAGSSYTNS